MARYLTPGKIGLLVLIEQYLNGQVASTARLHVLSFLAPRINYVPPDAEVLPLAVDGNGNAQRALEELASLPSDIPGRTVYDILLQRLWMLEGLDDLHVLFGQLVKHLGLPQTGDKQQKGVSRASPFGQYIRRGYVEFTRLQFADAQGLWNDFVSYRGPTYESWAQRNPDAAATRLPGQSGLPNAFSTLISPTESGATAGLVSAEDATGLMMFSLHQLQKLGIRLPNDLKSKLQQWVLDQCDSGVQSLQHFLAFFEHWKAGQYTMALESLHRYFDYSLVARSTGGTSENMRVYYQYALLHLSVLHADFDCWDESVEAMDECIATARENQDTACLNFALSWLLYLRQAKPGNRDAAFGIVSGLLSGEKGEHDEIAFLKARAKDTKHWSLLSSTLLEEAKLDMYTSGGTARPIEHITQSAYLNVQHDLRTLMPAASLFESAIFDRLGLAHLGTRAHDTVKAVLSGQAPQSDRVRAICRSALNTAISGRYSLAMQMLRDVMPQLRGTLKLEQRVLGFMSLIQLVAALRAEDLRAAVYHLAALHALRSLGDPEIDFEIDLHELELHMKQRKLDHALKSVNAHLKRVKHASGTDIAHRLHYLVLKSKVFAVGGQPAKGFSVALRAASTAAKVQLIPTLLEAIAVLARILLDLGEFNASRDILEGALPKLIETRQQRLTADALVTLGESYVGTAGYACEPGSGEQMHHMRVAEDEFERAKEVYATIEDVAGMLKCFACKARIARWRGDDASAAHADELYMQTLHDHQKLELSSAD